MPFSNIDKPSKYFNTKLYTGNSTGSTEQSITGLGFSPDMVWLKSRTDAEKHSIADTVRGATKTIHPHLTDAEETSAGHMVSFDSDGYTVGVDNYSWNKSGSNYASWCWRGSDSSAVSNTNGSITSTVSANTTSGFSIVSYTGDGVNNRTVGHGLGATPKFIIIKNRDNGTAYWSVINPRSTSTTNTNILYLNRTDAEADDTNIMGTNLPNSTTFGIGDYTGVNVNGNKHIAYCFAEVKGFSKFGSYTGNGNADGTFVYTGFKPAWIMVKGSSFAGDNWNIRDNQRTPINPANKNLLANDSRAEEPYYATDLLSNGFKARTSEAGHNSSGQTYIYMAFAENPFCSSKGIPTTAR